MNREEVLDSIKANVENKNLIKHMLATEVIMRSLAKRFGENEDEWGLTGLLHDIDMELVNGDMRTHSKLGADLAKEMGASDAVAQAILCHNQAHGIPVQTRLDRALCCVDPLTGLIVAAGLVQPEKKLARLKASSVQKRFNEKSFAAGADRNQIAECSQLGIPLGEFIDIGLKSMQSIAPRLGL